MSGLLFCILLAAVTIDGNDWQDDGDVTLSLRPTVSGTEGTAWYVHKEDGQLSAYTGRYQLDDSGAVPGVQLGLTHRWSLKRDLFGVPRWHFDYHYLTLSDGRYGVFAEYEEGTKGLDLSVIRSFSIDMKGKPGSTIGPRPYHLVTGEVLKLKQGMTPELILNPPPGFVKRSQWENRIRKEPRSVYRTSVLNKDWYGWSSDQSYIVLSLVAGESWDSGDARLFVSPGRNADESKYVFARGKYSIDLASNLDALQIDLPLTRVYLGRWRGTGFAWQANDTSLDATGLTLCVPLEDRMLRDDLLTMYVAATYFVDEQGNRQRRYNSDGRFLKAATEKLVDSALNLDLGTTYFVRPGRLYAGDEHSLGKEKDWMTKLESDPPPGFRLRSREQPHAVAKAIVLDEETITALDADQLSQLAEHVYDNGQYREALKAYDRLIQFGTNKASNHLMRGHCYYCLKQYNLALADYDIAIATEPSAWKLVQRANAHDKLGRYDAAIQDYKRAHELKPDDAEVYNGAAWIWATCPDASVRDGKRAFAAAKRACELTTWSNFSFIDTLAAAYAECGDFPMAVKYQEMAQRGLSGEILEEGERRLDGYRRRVPYREP